MCASHNIVRFIDLTYHARYLTHASTLLLQCLILHVLSLVLSLVLQGYAEHALPIDTLVSDMAWHYHNETQIDWGGYAWSPELFPTPSDFIDELGANNLNTVLNLHLEPVQHGVDGGYFELGAALGWDAATLQGWGFPAIPGGAKLPAPYGPLPGESRSNRSGNPADGMGHAVVGSQVRRGETPEGGSSQVHSLLMTNQVREDGWRVSQKCDLRGDRYLAVAVD